MLEIALVFAHVTNRTLVLPPKLNLNLIAAGLGVEDFYDIQDLRKAIKVLSAHQFLDQIGINDESFRDFVHYREFLRANAVNPKFEAFNEVLAIPSISLCESSNPVDYPNFDTFAAGKTRRELTQQEVNARILHLRMDYPGGYRFFGLWYGFFYFSNPSWQKSYSDLIRKHFHYNDFLFDIAAELISSVVREHGEFNSMHIRRGDFSVAYQYTQLSAEEMVQNVLPLLQSNNASTLLISSDETEDSFFLPFKAHFHVIRSRDLTQGVPIQPHYLGLLDQLLCSAGEVFIGTELSTFSAHITRLRFSLDAGMAPGKGFYLTTRKYSGNATLDALETNASWMNDGRPLWPHYNFFREFFDFLK